MKPLTETIEFIEGTISIMANPIDGVMHKVEKPKEGKVVSATP